MQSNTQSKQPGLVVSFVTAGMGGMMGWVCVHPFNTAAVRMNLAAQSAAPAATVNVSFIPFTYSLVQKEGFGTLYAGLSAGLLRQIFYSTSRFGLFEVFRDELAKYRKTDMWSRLLTGVTSGGIAALISCPAEVTLVRISNDNSQPLEKRRNYKGVVDAFQRIIREEGPKAFFSGSGPFVNRAMLVGAVQIGSYDQLREKFKKLGMTNPALNVFYASMVSGLLYSVITMPFETAKNRMAFQSVDPLTGKKPYTSAIQTMTTIARKEGVLSLWRGFPPYYLRCGGHTVCMFMSVEWLRGLISQWSK